MFTGLSQEEKIMSDFFFDKNIDFEISLAFDVVESECTYRRVCVIIYSSATISIILYTSLRTNI